MTIVQCQAKTNYELEFISSEWRTSANNQQARMKASFRYLEAAIAKLPQANKALYFPLKFIKKSLIH